MADTLLNTQPESTLTIPPVILDGPLQRLKTLAEVQASEATIDVYIAEVHPKAVKVACDAMRPLLPDDHKKINLAHLRRPCTYAQLPEHLQSTLCPPSFFEAITPRSRRKKGGNKSSFIMLCATCLVEEQKLFDAIVEALPAPEYVAPSRLYTIPVPLFPPVSIEQAEKWSAMYWPTSFKNNNPYGPHPASIARAEWELMNADTLNSETCMQLARAVAADSTEFAMGQAVGVVVVERLPGRLPRIVAVASDARYRGYTAAESDRSCGGTGNITAHAVMRAIGMVAQKRRIIDKRSEPLLTTDNSAIAEDSAFKPVATSADPATMSIPMVDDSISCMALLPSIPGPSDIYLDVPMTEREKRYFDPPTLSSRGYLCLNLELYTTHEPCIMCSMAILHSRFGRAVFEKPMRSTGAMMAQRPEEPATFKGPEPVMPSKRALPPTKSAKRRNTRKNARLRAVQVAIDQQKAHYPPLEYGLWWRSQLNWKFLCWQWRQDRVSTKAASRTVSACKSSSSSEAGTSNTSPSRRQSSSDSSQAARESSIEELGDLVKSMSVVHIPDSVHI